MVNNFLQSQQLEQVFGFIFPGKNITVIRFLRHAGRSRVCWIYYSVGKTLRATFISFKELLQAYYRWLANLDLFNTRLDERKAIGRANWYLLSVGDVVFHAQSSSNQFGIIVDKAVHNYLPVFWINWGNATPVLEMPWSVEVF